MNLLTAWREQVKCRLSEETDNGDCAAVHVIDLAPTEFLDLTDTDWGNRQSEPLDPARMSDWSELPCLHLFDDGAVFGHEGRHRVAAARDSGLSTVPIVVWLFQRQAVEAGRLEELNTWTSQFQPLPPQPWTKKGM